MPIPLKAIPNYWLTVICLSPVLPIAPLDLHKHLSTHNIETRCVWKPMHLQPVFKNSIMIGGKVCEEIFQTGLCLPSGGNLTQAQQDRVIMQIISFFKEKRLLQKMKSSVA